MALFVFFRRLVVVGREHIPEEGQPVLFVGNHPNSLVDPILLLVAVRRESGRHVRFLAKDVLFHSPLRPVLTALGAVPVARRVDSDDPKAAKAADAPGSVDNQAAFSVVDEVLGQGGVIGIFPEGLSHDEAQLQRLKTGAARMAFSAKKAHPDLPLRIVPCGLNYINAKRFRSQVLVQFGAPIEVDQQWLADFAGDERKAVNALTSRIDAALRAQTINAPDWDTLRMLDAARRLYQPPEISLGERVELARRFAEAYPKIAGDPEVKAVAGRIDEYVARLEAAGLDDRDLKRRIGRAEALGRLARHVMLAILWLPLAVPGLFVHLPVGLLARVAGHRFAPRRDVMATTKLVVGIALSLISYGVCVALAGHYHSLRYAVIVAAGLPISGVAGLVVLDRSRAVTRILQTLGRLGRLDRELGYLADERAALEAEVVRLVDRYRPTHLVPMFPRDEAQL
jgi:glycerol-3-phosphate O-acyltransferase/dihydroxyacetone phosphate acyltransferase